VRSREGVIGTVVDPETGEIEELIGRPDRDIPKPQARKGIPVITGRGVQGEQFQTDPTKKGRKGGKGGKSQPSGVGVIGEVGQTAPDKKGRQGQRQIS
jgi:hypothetical protein